MLVITTHCWGNKYPPYYVERLHSAVKRNLKQPFRFLMMTDKFRAPIDGVEQVLIPDEDHYLLQIQGCLSRLRLFDPNFQKDYGLNGRIVSLDLDLVVTGGLDEPFGRKEEFVVLSDINTANPCPYNGSVWMLRAGYRPDVWTSFSLEAASKMKYHSFPDDQGWFWHLMPNAAGFTYVDGCYAFKKKHWPSGDDLPVNARIVAFPGWRDPGRPMFQQINWIKEHWRDDKS